MLLSDIRVIEIGQVLSAPFAGMILADLGAEVIKVEKPSVGDDARNMGPAFRDGASMVFHDVNRGKRSVQIDLKTKVGLEQLFCLLADADVLIHNLRPGDAIKLGIDSVAMRERFPALIYCEMSAFGHKGPRQRQPGYESLLQAYSGLVSMNGSPDSPPSRIGASVVDQGAGMWAVIGVLAALHGRSQSSQGSVVNTSLLETALTWSSTRIHAYVNEGRESKRYGTGHPNLVPYQAFDMPEGQIMICAGNDRLFAKLAVVLGKPQWAQDDRFDTNRNRLKHRDVLIPLIEQALSAAPRVHWLDALQREGVPAVAVNSIPEVIQEEQVIALDMFREVEDKGFVLAGLPISFDGVRPVVERAAPALGEANNVYLSTFTE